MARSLRFWISLGLSSFVALAMLTVVAVLLGVLLPRLNAEVETKNRSLGETVAAQVVSFLGNATSELERLASDIALQPAVSTDRLRVMLDAVANSSAHFEAIYLVNASDHVFEVGLQLGNRDERPDLLGADFSGRIFVQDARRYRRSVWSDTYLSSRGRIVVAIAVPMTLPEPSAMESQGALVAELNLEDLSRFAREIGNAANVLPIVVDRRGQVVAHPDPARSVRQENISHLPVLRNSANKMPQTAVFRLDDTDYIGSTTPISGPGWVTLVAQPTTQAFATVRSTMLALGLVSLLALSLALVVAFLVSRRMTRRVAEFGRHIQSVAEGDYRHFIPTAGTNEIENLAQSIRRMARAVLERENSLRLAASVFESSAEGILITDPQLRILSVNPALVSITGYQPHEVLGKTPAVFKSGRQDAEFYRQMWADIADAGFWRGEIWNQRKDGVVFPEMLTISVVRDADDNICNYIGSFFDISERKLAEERIQFLAHHDALTQLPNRTLLNDRLHQAIAKSRRNQDHTAVLFLDLDRFKLINDTLGHHVGDRMLTRVAEMLQGILRETETVARLGGDEFIIVIPELAEVERTATVARKVIDMLTVPLVIDGQVLHITASIGISLYPEDGTDTATLLSHADTAMYNAKDRGGNNFQFFTPTMNQVIQERVAVEHDLHLALERGEFVLHYQPQVDCRTGEVTSMEALIRWQHPTRGLVSPFHFITIAEETGLIVPIGEWVLWEACRQTRRWHDAGQTGLRISVNLSARQFQQPDLRERIDAVLRTTGIDPATLELELTESMLMTDPDAATGMLHQLAALGVKMAIDDFGTGYSSLAYLKRFPVTRLKIDQSFVRDISTDLNDAAIVSAVVAMAASLKLEVIAEGVETEEQLRYLAAHGCYDIQGYYFSRPKPAEDFNTFGFEPLTLIHP
jgi:diguanylate cyclase (GGDEF)-like protein/PAS domain S-box-containing protein